MEPFVLKIGQTAIDSTTLFLAMAGFAALLLLALFIVQIVSLTKRGREREERASQAHALETELAEMKGRLQAVAEMSVSRQAELSRSINDRLDKVSHRLGQNLTETTQKTSDSLSKLNERLAVIDTAQKNITELSSNVVTLQEILSNKQSRGAFGQGRMEAIIKDGLPKDAYSFQATLSNRNRPDCLIRLPNAPGLVIDAKFPLEGFEAFRTGRSERDRAEAMKRVRADVNIHVGAIADKYHIPGETQDQSLMFVPSEAIYADLHEHFPDLIQKAMRARVVIVSPNMLMLAVQTMLAILKDVRMREQAGLIQKEVTYLVEDVHRLRERVVKLQAHFGQANQDIEKILTSSDRISMRGRRIETLDFQDTPQQEAPKAVESTETSAAKPTPAKPVAAKPAEAKGANAPAAPGAPGSSAPRKRASIRPAGQRDLLAGE
ncbi:MAG: DNA recombination protein RmuC [Pseudomonadota bacterium]|nr:DNA recombination protein RmuC [Pseudomonadota bacterium]